MTKRMDRTKALVSWAFFIALTIIFKSFLSFYPVPTIRISLENVSIMLSALFYGPVGGAVVGVTADVLGTILFPPSTGAMFYLPLTVTPLLVGILTGFARPLIGKEMSYWRLCLVILVVEFIAPYVWSSIALSMLYGTPLLVQLSLRFPARVIIALMDMNIVFLLYKRLCPLYCPEYVKRKE